MAAYLKHRETGEILPFNPDLATNPDMVQCDRNGNEEPELEVLEDPSNAPRAKKAKKVEVDEFAASDLSEIVV
jgi:hypothetical protein